MKLIQTQEYLLLIDEEAEIKYNTIIFESDTCLINVAGKDYVHNKTDSIIIAYYPLNSEAKELDLPLLPNPFEEIDVEKLSEKANGYAYYGKPLGEKYLAFKEGFIEGYKAAQSNKQFSLEDIKKAIEMAREQDCSNFEYYGFCEKAYTDDDIIQSLSAQQLPVSFEPEYRYYYHSSKEFYSDAGFVECSKEQYESIKVEILACPLKTEIKTITNSEGKQELVGIYKY